jgi:hypothetical protein
LARHAQTCGDAVVAKPLARQEHDLGPHDITIRRRILLGPSVQFGLLLFGKLDRKRAPPRRATSSSARML